MYISVIVPAYNEEKRLGMTLQRLHSYLEGRGYEYEVIVVDDGSKDGTGEVAVDSSVNRAGRLKILRNDRNRGKGFSVRRGILASNGDYVLFTDADLSTPIEEVERLLSCVESGFHIAIASRSMRGADMVVHQPFWRECMGKIFNLLVRVFVMRGFIDTQCGFKLFKADAAMDIASRLRIDRFSFDVEMIYLALRGGYKVKDVPVTWIHSSPSKVHPVNDSCRMMMDLFRIKRLHR